MNHCIGHLLANNLKLKGWQRNRDRGSERAGAKEGVAEKMV